MALSSNLNRKVFTASAAQTAFAFGDVLYFDQTHMKWYVNGVLKTLSTHYTMSPTTNTPNGTPGGTVTFLTPMVGGEQVVGIRDVPIVQEIDYQENEKFPANTHEKGLDWLTMICQQFNEKFGRSIVLPVTSTKSNIAFPDLIAANSGRVIRILPDLTGLEAVDMGTTPYASVLTAKGDLPTYDSAQVRLPVGANESILEADSAQTKGIKWTDFVTKLTSKIANIISSLKSDSDMCVFTTGDVKLTIKTVADSGWVLMNDGTIGSATSGATTRANADTQQLFTLLWNNTANSECAVSSGRGASAAADFAANKTIALPKSLGRALACYGAGSGLTSRAMAKIVGSEDAIVVTHNHGVTDPGHVHTYLKANVPGSAVNTGGYGFGDGNTGSNTTGITINNAGSSGTGANMQPSVFLNVMVKL